MNEILSYLRYRLLTRSSTEVIDEGVNMVFSVVYERDRVQLSEKDSLRVLDLLENPPEPNAKLLDAARALREAISS